MAAAREHYFRCVTGVSRLCIRKKERGLLPLFVYLLWINAGWIVLILGLYWTEALAHSTGHWVCLGYRQSCPRRCFADDKDHSSCSQGNNFRDSGSLAIRLSVALFQVNPISSAFDSLEILE